MDFFSKQSPRLHDPAGFVALPAVSCASQVIWVEQVSPNMGKCFTFWITIRPLLLLPGRDLLRPFASVFFIGLIYFGLMTICQGCKMKVRREHTPFPGDFRK